MKKLLTRYVFMPTLILSLAAPAFADPVGPIPTGDGKGGKSGLGFEITDVTAADAPPPAPPVDTSGARNAGYNDGRREGALAGRERGITDGRNEGQREGYNDGYNSCYAREEQRRYDLGYSNGYRDGERSGAYDGQNQGERDGSARGIREGQADGDSRADRDARAAATGPGHDKGIDQANHSNALARGQADGTAAGDRDARAEAVRTDYPRGRADYRDERIAEAVQNRDEINQKAPPRVAQLKAQSKILTSSANALDTLRSNDSRGDDSASGTIRITANYGTPEENQAYQEGYRQGYQEGYQNDYRAARDQGYREVYNRARESGCNDGIYRNHDSAERRGYDEGRDRGYRSGYDSAYRDASNRAYNREFGPASDRTYRNNYSGYYQNYFEAARSEAYNERYHDLYQSTYQPAYRAKYDTVYPTYAQQEYQRGRADEAEDFRVRPIRFQSAEATETILNGVLEPNEPLRFHLNLRNFSANELAASDISIEVQAPTDGSGVVTEAKSALVKSIRSKSVTDVREALEFKLNESAADRSVSFKVRLLYKGKLVDETTVKVVPRFLLQMEFADPPQLKEGIAMPLRLKVTNIGQRTSASDLRIKLTTRQDIIEVAQPDLAVGSIEAGQSKIVEYSAIAHSAAQSAAIQLAFSATAEGGRRIGLFDRTQQIPMINDYRITLTQPATALRGAGVTRLSYQIRNVSSRLLYKSLQLKVRFLETDESNFDVIGPNPQYLMPIEAGEQTQFVIPVLSKNANAGGIIELEVQEDGHTVVIHRADFRAVALQ